MVLSYHFCLRSQATTAYYKGDVLEFSSELNGVTGSMSFADFSADGRALGHIECFVGGPTDCAVHFFDVTKGGIKGRFGVPQSTNCTRQLCSPPFLSCTYLSLDSADFYFLCLGLQDEARVRSDPAGLGLSRRLAASDAAPFVENPVQCLHLHDTVAWWVGDGIYPVFLKDSLLNTNAALDLSPFSKLQSTMQSQLESAAKGSDNKQRRNLEVSRELV